MGSALRSLDLQGCLSAYSILLLLLLLGPDGQSAPISDSNSGLAARAGRRQQSQPLEQADQHDVSHECQIGFHSSTPNLTDAAVVSTESIVASANLQLDGQLRAARFNQPRGIAMSADGFTILVADVRNRHVRNVSLQSNLVSTVSKTELDVLFLAACPDEQSAVVASASALFVLSFASGEVRRLAGSERGWADGNATHARFGDVQGIAVATDGHSVLVADDLNKRLRRVSLTTGEVDTIAGSGGEGSEDGMNASFSRLYAVAANAQSAFLADGHAIRAVSLATGEVRTLAGSVRGFADGAGSEAMFDTVTALAATPTYVLIADAGNHRVRRLSLVTRHVDTLAGSGVAASEDGRAPMSSFNHPWGIASVPRHDGVIVVTERGSHRIRRLSVLDGTVDTVAGSHSSHFANGPNSSALFDAPAGVAVFSKQQRAVIADTFNHMVRVVELATGVVDTLAGSGVEGYKDGAAASARFRRPQSVAVSADETLVVVADAGNQRIRVVMAESGQVSTVGAEIEGLWGVAMIKDSMEVVVTGRHKVMRVALAAGAETEVVAGAQLAGFAEGVGAAARFDHPRGVAVTPDGAVAVVADSGNGRLRVVHLVDRTVSTLAGAGQGSTTSSLVGAAGDGTIQRPSAVAASAHPRWMLVVAEQPPQLVMVDVATGAARVLLRASQPSRAFGGVVASADAKSALLVQAAGGALLRVVPQPQCRPCENTLPLNAEFEGSGSETGFCPWRCVLGSVLRGGSADGCDECGEAGAACAWCGECVCGAGFAAASNGSCSPCEPGTSKATEGARRCGACAPGEFQAAGGASACARCAAGKFQPRAAATTCDSCGPGKFANGSGRAACSECVHEHSVSAAQSVRAEDCVCAPGYTGDDGQRCVECEPGTYKAQQGSAPCQRCTNKPAGAEYTANLSGFLTGNACPWECSRGFVAPNDEICVAAAAVSFAVAIHQMSKAEFQAEHSQAWVEAVADIGRVPVRDVRIEAVTEHPARRALSTLVVETQLLVLPASQVLVRSLLTWENLQSRLPQLEVGEVLLDVMWADNQGQGTPPPLGSQQHATRASIFILVGTVAAGILLFLCGILGGLYYRKSQLAARQPVEAVHIVAHPDPSAAMGEFVHPPPLPHVLRQHGLDPTLPRPIPLHPAPLVQQPSPPTSHGSLAVSAAPRAVGVYGLSAAALPLDAAAAVAEPAAPRSPGQLESWHTSAASAEGSWRRRSGQAQHLLCPASSWPRAIPLPAPTMIPQEHWPGAVGAGNAQLRGVASPVAEEVMNSSAQGLTALPLCPPSPGTVSSVAASSCPPPSLIDR